MILFLHLSECLLFKFELWGSSRPFEYLWPYSNRSVELLAIGGGEVDFITCLLSFKLPDSFTDSRVSGMTAASGDVTLELLLCEWLALLCNASLLYSEICRGLSEFLRVARRLKGFSLFLSLAS